MGRLTGSCQQFKRESRYRGEAKFTKNITTARESRPPHYIWRPTVPSWEKEFTAKVGLFRWEEFVELKKSTKYFNSDKNSKVTNWNDSAAEEAFKSAKSRFWHQYHNNNNATDIKNVGRMSTMPLPDPDMYIDIIDWDDSPQPDAADLTEAADFYEELPLPSDVKVKNIEIKPTGWDVDIEEEPRADLLTGLVVGDHFSSDEEDHGNILQDKINVPVSQPYLRNFRKIT